MILFLLFPLFILSLLSLVFDSSAQSSPLSSLIHTFLQHVASKVAAKEREHQFCHAKDITLMTDIWNLKVVETPSLTCEMICGLFLSLWWVEEGRDVAVFVEVCCGYTCGMRGLHAELRVDAGLRT